MPRALHRWRLLFALPMAFSLLASPGVALANPVVRFSEEAVSLYCDAGGPEGELHLSAGVSSEFGPSADFVVWLAPVDPSEPPDFTASGTGVVFTPQGDGGLLVATLPLLDSGGTVVGNLVVNATLTPDGDPFRLEPSRQGNRWIKTTGTIAPMAVTGTLDAPGDLPDFLLEELGCFAEVVDISVFETQPHAFVLNHEGVLIDCSWESQSGFAYLFAIVDNLGTFAEAALFTEDVVDLYGSTDVLALTPTSLEAVIPMTDLLTGEPATAVASATLSPVGSPVESLFLFQGGRQRVTEQRLVATGTLELSTGDVRMIDGTCFSVAFDSHLMLNTSAGPRAGGRAPANDTVEGATPIRMGGRVNDQTRGAAVEAEIQVTGCPEPDDQFGHTLWYSFTGTGTDVTVDTAGSDFDTVVAVYDDALALVACNDDITFDPVGGSFQGALSIPTVAGATYYVQVGGFVGFDTGMPEFGRLRLSVTAS